MKPEDSSTFIGKNDAIEARYPGLAKYVRDIQTAPEPTAEQGQSTFIMFTDGEGGLVADYQKDDANSIPGSFIGKDDALKSIEPLVMDFLRPTDLSIYRPVIEGELAEENDPYRHLPKSLAAAFEPVVIKVSLEDWLELKDKSPAGVDPVLGDFLRANPDYFDPAKAEGDGITLRQLGLASDSLTRFNRTKPMIMQGSDWVAPKAILDSFLTPEIADELISFAKSKGINVQTGLGNNQKLVMDSSPKL